MLPFYDAVAAILLLIRCYASRQRRHYFMPALYAMITLPLPPSLTHAGRYYYAR